MFLSARRGIPTTCAAWLSARPTFSSCCATLSESSLAYRECWTETKGGPGESIRYALLGMVCCQTGRCRGGFEGDVPVGVTHLSGGEGSAGASREGTFLPALRPRADAQFPDFCRCGLSGNPGSALPMQG